MVNLMKVKQGRTSVSAAEIYYAQRKNVKKNIGYRSGFGKVKLTICDIIFRSMSNNQFQI